jgi:hypothetical protein
LVALGLADAGLMAIGLADRRERAASDAGAAERSSGDSRTSSVPAPLLKEGSRRLLAPRPGFANSRPVRHPCIGSRQHASGAGLRGGYRRRAQQFATVGCGRNVPRGARRPLRRMRAPSANCARRSHEASRSCSSDRDHFLVRRPRHCAASGDFCGAGGNACAAVVSWGRGSSLFCAAEKRPIQEG